MIPYAADSKEAQIEENIEGTDSYYEQEKKVKWTDKVLLNRPSKVVTASLIAAVALPLILYNFTVSSTLGLPPRDGYSFGSCIIPREIRLPCGRGNITEQQCHESCCYDLSNNVCFHTLPSRFSYIMDRPWTEGLNLQPREPNEPFSFQDTLPDIQLSIDEVSRSHLTLSFYYSREVEPQNGTRLNETDYSISISSPELSILVDTLQGTIFSTNRGPLIAANNIWEMSFKLTNESMYGLGEIPLVRGMVKVIYSHRGDSNSIPLIFAKSNGSYHGLLIDVDTPTEISVQGSNQIVVRSITKTQLRFHLFVGPEPDDIMRDVMKFIGFENNLKYWMLGAHICNSEPSLSPAEKYENFTTFLNEAEENGLLYESHCGIAPIVLGNINETTEILTNGSAALEEHNKRFIPHLSPYQSVLGSVENHHRYLSFQAECVSQFIISQARNDCVSNLAKHDLQDCPSFIIHEKIRYGICNDTSEESNITRISNCDVDVDVINEFNEIMLQNSDGFYIGKVNEFDVIYPDYNNETSRLLIEQLWGLNSSYDAIILENNWPLDESFKLLNETYLHLPYFNEHFEKAFNETLPWNITKPNQDLHMYDHNKYGNHFFSNMKLFSGENASLYTSSQWMNGQAIINRQNVETSWANFRKELTQVALSSISGHWLQSSPICGDSENFDPTTQTSLCVKWYQAATYLPLIKIHSTKVVRHPLAFLGTNQQNMMDALEKRHSFLPHFYTVLQKGPLLRPMFYQFPHFEALENVTSQFSVGDEMLIVPALLPAQSHVIVRMPPGTWYEFWSGLKIDAEEGAPVQMASTEADLLTLIRGGSVIFMQKNVQISVEETRLNSNYSITIALECSNNTDSLLADATVSCTAQGSIYITNAMSLSVTADSERISITTVGQDFAALCGEVPVAARILKEIIVYGLNEEDNNYDHYRHVDVAIDLCNLQTREEISFVFVE